MATALKSNTAEKHETKHVQRDGDQDITGKPSYMAIFAFTTRGHIPILFAAISCAVVGALTLPTLSILYGLVFRQFADFGAGRISGSILLRNTSRGCLYMVGVSAINWLANSLYFMLFLMFGELQAMSARARIFNVLIHKDMTWYDTRENGTSAFLSGVQTHIRDLQLSTSQALGELVQCIIMGVGALGVALFFAWDLALVTICTVPLIYLIMGFLSGRLSKRAHEQADKLQEALKYVLTAIQNVETVKCFNGERFELQKVMSAMTCAGNLYTRQANLRSLQIGFMQFVTLSMFVQGFWYGSHLVTSGKRNAGQVVTTFWGAMMAVQGITGFLPQLIILQKGKVAGARLKALMTEPLRSGPRRRSPGTLKPKHFSGDVEFRQVSFTYPARPAQSALIDASIFFPAGETTFVIGRSGSGKSTLGQLLVRFYEPSVGQIFIDNSPLETIDTQWLRENITLVEQQSVLFNDTIRHNIALGKKDYQLEDNEVKETLSFAALKQLIQDLPEGLETFVGSKGSSLSGGQRQRVAMARARLRDTPVLILDESTNALDYITRSMMLEAIRRWRRGKTTIVITHDISQVLPDDYVYVLDNARVVEEGYRKVIEASSTSAFCTLSSFQEQETCVNDAEDDTKEIVSLYAASWANQLRPSSFYGEPVISPFFTSTRNRDSYIIDGRYQPHTPANGFRRTGHPSNANETPVVGLKPPFAVLASGGFQETSRCPPSFARPSSVVSQRPKSLFAGTPVLAEQKIPASHQEDDCAQSDFYHYGGKAQGESTATVANHSMVKIIRDVWSRLSWGSRFKFVGGFICAMIHAAATPSFGYVFAQLLSTFYAASAQNRLASIYALSILGIAIVDGLASYGLHFLFDAAAQSWTNSLREEAMRRILLQPKEFFDQEENSVPRLAECLGHLAEEARNLPGRFVGIVAVIVAMLTVGIVWSLFTCWKLTLVALATGPVLFAVMTYYNKISSRWETHCNEAAGLVDQIFYETFVNISTVRCLVLEEVFCRKHSNAAAISLSTGKRRASYTGSVFGLNYASVLFVAALIFWFGAYLLSTTEFTTTRIIQTFTVLLLSVNHVNYIGNYIPQINIARDASTRLIRLGNLPTDSHERTGTVQLHAAGDITLENASFSYPTRKNHLVLRDVSFNISRGSCTAIVGASGSGKSTIAALLLKLYQTSRNSHDISPPSLRISGHDIKVLHTGWLRSQVSVVSQSAVLFPGTVAENIAYGLSPSSQSATLESIRTAAGSAGIDEFVGSLPMGYQTLIGEGGSGLSGGQAQRIAIARALVRSPDILILDEATSALDVESARVVRNTIQRLVVETKGCDVQRSHNSRHPVDRQKRKHMTIIIITHSREMMAIAENVIMLEQGRVVEEGSFEELKQKRGPFARLLRGDDQVV